ncbi:TPA: hypothetical protein ACH3X3_008548 [Trebouxia sp. C0006]
MDRRLSGMQAADIYAGKFMAANNFRLMADRESTRMVLARKTRSPGAKSTWKAVLAMNANLLSAFYITVVVFNVVILIPTEDLVAQLY